MKRFLSFALVSLFVILPMGVKAETELSVSCSSAVNGIKTCTLSGSFDSTDSIDSMNVVLEEEGGADITSIEKAAESQYIVGADSESGNTHSFTITHDDATYGPASSGEITLFAFSYKVSGEKDCKIIISIDSNEVETPPTGTTPQKQTGSSVPYIALGTMVVLAGGAYLLTRNKSKMFNI